MQGSKSFKAVAFAALFLLSCSCSSDKGPPQERVSSVAVETASQQDVPIQIRVIGNVEPYSVVTVKSQIGGVLSKVNFKEGQDVQKGDLLFVIDPRPYEAALKQAQANQAKDVALLKNAREQLERYGALVEKGYVAKEQYDQVQAGASALEATVEADKALVENSGLQLSYCYIYSPIDGRTGTLAVTQGNLVKAIDSVLVTINQVSPIYATFSVPERNLPEIRRRMADRTLQVEALPDPKERKAEQGTLTFIENEVDTSTGTIKMKATFSNKERHLWPGQFVDIVLTLSVQQGAVIVPSRAVQVGQEGSYAFVVKPDMTVEARKVTTGVTFNGLVAVIKGLAAGERVVTDGQLRLVPGAKVAIKEGQQGAPAR